MTLSPVDNPHSAKARPDLPSYKLNGVCPRFPDRMATDNHHVFRRSLGQGFRDAYWVELEDGQIIPNRIGLSPEAHRKITDNEARIVYLGPEEGWAWLEKELGDWELWNYIKFPAYAQLTLDGHEVPHEAVVAESQPAPGSTCETCHRRVPHKQKTTTPKTRPLAYRIPVEDAEAHMEIIDTVADLLGVKEQPYHRFKTISYALAAVLQGARLTERGA